MAMKKLANLFLIMNNCQEIENFVDKHHYKINVYFILNFFKISSLI